MRPSIFVAVVILILFGAATFYAAAPQHNGSDEMYIEHDLRHSDAQEGFDLRHSDAQEGFDLRHSDAQVDNYSRTIEKWLEEGALVWNQTGDIPSLITHYAERQLGIDYVGGLLDESDEEELVVTLSGSDCVIYVEMSLALAMTTLQRQDSYDAFRENLKFIRYREGNIDGYPSRLHYFSDWLITNQEKGVLAILFQGEDAVDFQLPAIQPPVFMSENREKYRHLAVDDEIFRKMKQMERNLSGIQLYYIPQDRIPEIEHRLQAGDVLAFVTTIGGLDISHTALVNMTEKGAGFYHASLTGSVILDSKSVYQYTKDRRNIKGIITARLRPPIATRIGSPNE